MANAISTATSAAMNQSQHLSLKMVTVSNRGKSWLNWNRIRFGLQLIGQVILFSDWLKSVAQACGLIIANEKSKANICLNCLESHLFNSGTIFIETPKRATVGS